MLKIISSRLATLAERRARRVDRDRLNSTAETFPEEDALVAAFDAETHPLYLQEVTLGDGRTGTIVHVYDRDYFEFETDTTVEMIHRYDLDADSYLRSSPETTRRISEAVASFEAGLRGMQERTHAPRDDGLEPDHPDYFKRYLGAADGLAMMEADGWNFDCPGDEFETLHDGYLHIRYSSPLFEREWQNLLDAGWTTITVPVFIDGDTGNLHHVAGAMGAGWRCWTQAGGYEIITHKPDWIMANLDPTLKAYVG